MSTTPVRFAFGIHIHQPVGNFDHVFEQHVDQVYRPFLDAAAGQDFLPVALHISGPLLEWLETRGGGRYLDLVGRLAADGKLELLLAGMYEPILVSLPPADRIEQIQWMRDALRRRFGVDAEGLWLTERVWEPQLAADLSRAGVKYALVDDRHFLVTGFGRDHLHAPLWTEAEGRKVALFPIDERLRYLIPFRPPGEIAAYFEDLHAAGHRLAVFADDGEKFGGWPGTHEWVYQRGWLNQFFDTIGRLRSDGIVQLCTFRDALKEVPSQGLAYLPSASYREMEEWSLPADAARRLAALNHQLGEERLLGPDGGLVRGGHWRNFLARYPESNRMHKKMQSLSFISRERGDPPAARQAIGRAQCNDAYWHGVFGGLYLPHLRGALWHQLAQAERVLRAGEPLTWEVLDFEADGHDEIWVHSSVFSALVSPRRGGTVEEYTVFSAGVNYVDVLTRRHEAYHYEAVAQGNRDRHAASDGAPSIHDIEHSVTLATLPPADPDDRALFVDRVFPGVLRFEEYQSGSYACIRSWAGAPLNYDLIAGDGTLEIVFRPKRPEDQALIEKRLRFDTSGRLRASWRWDARSLPADAFFATELSLSREIPLRISPEPRTWTFPIRTVAKSERGLDETRQGDSVTPQWPVAAAQGSIELVPPTD